MELVMVFITLTCIFFSALLIPSSSLPIQAQSSHKQANYYEVQASLPALPRKLRFTEEVNVVGQAVSASMPKKKQEENVSGNQPHKNKEDPVVVHGSKGTWQEYWAEGTDTSDFFTMDYSKVKRRRPIHNKSTPVFRP